MFNLKEREDESQGFIKVGAGVIVTNVANCLKNAEQIIDLMRHAADDGVALLALPELSLTGYTAADLLVQPYLLEEAKSALDNVLSMTATVPVAAVVGMPLSIDGRLYNCAVVISEGEVWGVVPKVFLPNYGEFYESRWFTSGSYATARTVVLSGKEVPFGTDLIFCNSEGVKFGIEVCEDVWVPCPPSIDLALGGAQVIVNISASNELVCKDEYRSDLVRMQSAHTVSAYVYASAGYGESTTDVVYGGSTYIAENGSFLAKGERFLTTAHYVTADVDITKLDALRLHTSTFVSMKPRVALRTVEVPMRTDLDEHAITRSFAPHPFVPEGDANREARCKEIFSIQTSGLARRIEACRAAKAVIGVSGGLDSTLALLVAVRTMDLLGRPHKDVVGITMPGFGTTSRTHVNALGLMKALGVTTKEIDITAACRQHLKDIEVSEDDRSVTYENAQARERTQILMDYANKVNGLVVGTGDLSELALGWATYNGDQMSMYGVNAGVPKTLVRYVTKYVADSDMYPDARKFLLDIIDTPISPELLPADEKGEIAQKTEDLVGPYELHDFFLYHFMRFGFGPKRLYMMATRAFEGVYAESIVKKWLVVFLRRFFSQQFKRSAMPDGPKVGSISLSPRGDWRMPSDVSSEMWLAEANEL